MPGRKALILFFALLMAVLGIAPAHAQPARANHIAAELVAAGPALPGGTVELAILMTPEKTWHGYWSNPGDAGYGMQLNWSAPPGWQAGQPEYPVPHTLLISGLMNHVYEGQYAVLVPFKVPQDAVVGSSVPVTLAAEWLACTNEMCVPERGTFATTITVGGNAPADPRFDGWRAAIPPLIDSKASFAVEGNRLRIAIPLPASLEITNLHLFLGQREVIDYAAAQVFRRQGDMLIAELVLKRSSDAPLTALSGILKLDDTGNGVTFESAPGAVPAGGDLIESASTAKLPPLWSLLLLALGGGLLLNIMPCVFPILSLKALSLARAGESAAGARAEGLAYTAGVVLACLALGGLMLALRAAGNEIGWAFQLQEPGVVVALLVLAVVITANFAGLFEFPSLSFARGGHKSSAFTTGLLAAFVATPCTGPFMAAAMGAALLLPTEQALLLFAALGLGIALPFLALGFIPAMRRLLPKPGNWMNTFRKVMAVPMGLTALALLWLCWRLGGQWFALIALGMAVIVILWLRRGTKARLAGGSGAMELAMAAVMIVLGARALSDVYTPSSQAEQGIIAAQPFSEKALADARASGKPVFIWFTADWCLTCKVNEGIAIEREETRAAFEKAGVVALKGDWTRRDPEITRFLTAQGAAGVPLYLWYPAGGNAQQLPQVLTPDSLLRLAEAE